MERLPFCNIPLLIIISVLGTVKHTYHTFSQLPKIIRLLVLLIFDESQVESSPTSSGQSVPVLATLIDDKKCQDFNLLITSFYIHDDKHLSHILLLLNWVQEIIHCAQKPQVQSTTDVHGSQCFGAQEIKIMDNRTVLLLVSWFSFVSILHCQDCVMENFEVQNNFDVNRVWQNFYFRKPCFFLYCVSVEILLSNPSNIAKTFCSNQKSKT